MYKLSQALVNEMSANKEFVLITHKDILQHIRTEEVIPSDSGENIEELVQNSPEAMRMIEAARAEAEEIKKSAWQQGYEEGKEDARGEIEEFMKAQSGEAKEVFSKLAKYKEKLYGELQASVLQLSFDIAEKIVNIVFERDDTLYVGIVKKAIENLKGMEKFVLRVGRREYDRFFKDGAKWLRDETGCLPFEVICDNQMGEGDCILESEDGILNAGVKQQISRLRHVLEEKAETDENAV